MIGLSPVRSKDMKNGISSPIHSAMIADVRRCDNGVEDSKSDCSGLRSSSSSQTRKSKAHAPKPLSSKGKNRRPSEKQEASHWQRTNNANKKTKPSNVSVDPSSSNHSINILVCTANLGNAPPDAKSWKAWIPTNGRLIQRTKFPVRMTPPQSSQKSTECDFPSSPRAPPQREVSDLNRRAPSRRSNSKGRVPKRHSSDVSRRAPQRQASLATRQALSRHHSDLSRLSSLQQASDLCRKTPKGQPLLRNGPVQDEGDPRRSFGNSTGVTNESEDGYDAWLLAQQGQRLRKSRPKKPRETTNEPEAAMKNDSFSGSNVDDDGYANFLSYLKECNYQPDSNLTKATDNRQTRNNSIVGSNYEQFLKSLEKENRNQVKECGNPQASQDEEGKRTRPKPIRRKSTGQGETKKESPIRGRSRSIEFVSDTKDNPPTPIRRRSLGQEDPIESWVPQTPVKERRARRKSMVGGEFEKVSPMKSRQRSTYNASETKDNPPTPVRRRYTEQQDTIKSPDSESQDRSCITAIAGSSSGDSPVKERRGRRKSMANGEPEKSDCPPIPIRRRSMGYDDNKHQSPVPARRDRRNSISSGESNDVQHGQAMIPMMPKITKQTNIVKSNSGKDTHNLTGSMANEMHDQTNDGAKLVNAYVEEAEIKYPDRIGRPIENACYDLIVIGLQEATFSTSLSDEEKRKQKEKETKARKTKGANTRPKEVQDKDNCDSSDEGSVDSIESNDYLDDDGSISSVSELDEEETHRDTKKLNDENEEEEKKKKKKKGLMNATKSVGRKGLKVVKRISKATSKTAKTVNTLAGAGKDHTHRCIPSTPFHMIEQQKCCDSFIKRAPGSFEGNPSDLDELCAREKNVHDGAEATETTASNKKWTDTDVLHYGLESGQLSGYTRALSYQFGQMRLLVYYKSGSSREDVVKCLDVLSVKYQATGKAGLANKGGIVAEVAINKTTRLSFLTAHLEAHEGDKHYNARNDSFKDILMETGTKHFDASQTSHFTFAMGDLNYRTRLGDVQVGSERHIRLCHAMTRRCAWRTLNKYDELRASLDNHTCLVGFQTPYCNFPPTFKVGREEGYCYNIKRSPSYTDRILFKSADRLDSALQVLLYEPVEEFISSDHKPIRSAFSVRLNRDLKWKSTAQLLLENADITKIWRGDSPTGDCAYEVIPKTTTGSINGDRESMNFFVTNIQCGIIPHRYDYLRKQEKAEMPSPKVLFITNPSDALVPWEDPSKKKLFGFNLRKKKEHISSVPSEETSEKKSKLPSTSVLKETMRPIWKEEHVHFALQTHTEHGRPIDFSGGQLHISLMDTKTGAVIGSHSLNLAHLIICSREKANSNKARRSQTISGKERGVTRSKSNTKMKHGDSNSPMKAGHSRGYQFIPQPSPALRSAMRTTMSNLTMENDGSEPQLPIAVQNAADFLAKGTSRRDLYESIVTELGGASKYDKNDLTMARHRTIDRLEEFGVKSFRLNETLMEGGLVVGHIKCDVDVWWI